MMDNPRPPLFYHGSTSTKYLEKIRSISSIFNHGFEFTPNNKVYSTEEKFFLDNGAFTDDFDHDEWIECMSKFSKRNNDPDFVVLPDVFDDPMKTFSRAQKYRWDVMKFGFDYYYAVQKPNRFDRSNRTAIHRAKEVGADGIFIGGSWKWKRGNAKDLIEIAHKNDLKTHIGMPKDFVWAYFTGADSIDSTTISRNKNFSKMKGIEDQIRGSFLFQDL